MGEGLLVFSEGVFGGVVVRSLAGMRDCCGLSRFAEQAGGVKKASVRSAKSVLGGVRMVLSFAGVSPELAVMASSERIDRFSA